MSDLVTNFKDAIVYQIYPRSFQDSNGDGIGDLPGITSRLDYLAGLGINTLWLSPIFASPNDDNGYDISNYREIMPEFGTMADFDELLAEAKARGIGLMLDLVVNHSSDEHEWFIKSRSSKDNPYRDYYIWRDPSGYDEDGRPLPPNNWIAAFSPSAWEYDETTGQFYLHSFSVKQPDLNWENPKVREEVYNIMRFWLDKGVVGFRMDVINLLSKDPSFADDPAVAAGSKESSLGVIANGPRIHEFLQEMNREVLAHYPTITVGETPMTTIEDGVAYAGFDRGELDMIFTFEHMDVDANPQGFGKWSNTRYRLSDLKAVLSHWQKGLEGKAWNSLYWNNHDQPRAVSRFGNDSPELRVTSAKALGMVLHFLTGTPYIYQGEELGMTNVNFATLEEYNDLEIHNAYHAYVDSGLISHDDMMSYISYSGRDNARTPMQWSAEPGAGFTTGTPWLGLNPNYPDINALAAVADPNSVYHFYAKLIQARKDHPVIVDGGFELIDPDSDQVFCYSRPLEKISLTVVANLSDEEVTKSYAAGPGSLLLSNYPDDLGTTLRPYEAKAYLFNGS